MGEFLIPIRNKNGIVAYSKVDEDVHKKVINGAWNLFNGYATGTISNFKGRLHRYILSAKKGELVDHINNDRLDNRRENLRIANHSQNSQNRNKKKDAIHKYIGVSITPNKKRWRCCIQNKSTTFDNEEDAAYWYDYLALQIYGSHAKINGIQRPENFVEPIIKIINNKRAVKTKNGKYESRYKLDGKLFYGGLYETEEDASKASNEQLKELLQKKEDIMYSKDIERNIDGVAIIKANGKGQIYECLVDDDKYYELIKYSWTISDDYVHSKTNKRSTVRMHRLLLDVKENEIVDHINNDRLDNRIINLRIASNTLNSHNVTKNMNKTSKYKGVSLCRKTWQATISKDGKHYYIGVFKNQEDAAKAYNKKAIELYGEFASVNQI